MRRFSPKQRYTKVRHRGEVHPKALMAYWVRTEGDVDVFLFSDGVNAAALRAAACGRAFIGLLLGGLGTAVSRRVRWRLCEDDAGRLAVLVRRDALPREWLAWGDVEAWRRLVGATRVVVTYPCGCRCGATLEEGEEDTWLEKGCRTHGEWRL